jgi:U4/U6 small nuclear ribonucleoprotein PRP3
MSRESGAAKRGSEDHGEGAAKRSRASRWESSESASVVSSAINPEAIEKARQGALLAFQIQQKLAALEKPKHAPKLILDASGRAIDEKGNVLDKQFNAIDQKKKVKVVLTAAPTVVNSEFFDKQIGVRSAMPAKRAAFKFIPEGKLSAQADELRASLQLQEYVSKSKSGADGAASGGINLRSSMYIEAQRKLPNDPVPDIEWWDAELVSGGSYSSVTSDKVTLRTGVITKLIEHPVLLPPPGEKEPPPIPVYLTKRERKKLRRRNRMQRELEKQEAVRRGLAAPAPPKVKISNLMRVLGTEATMDPTKIEKEVKQQMASRVAAHEARNQQRKLSNQERASKENGKIISDQKSGIFTLVFFVKSLENKLHRAKVNLTARKLQLRGCALCYSDCSLVIVEGGAKACKKFKALMLRRIKWAGGTEEMSDSDEDDDAGDLQSEQHCKLMWEGCVLKHAFELFRFEVAKSEAGARLFLQRRQVRFFIFPICFFLTFSRLNITGISLEHFTARHSVLQRLLSDINLSAYLFLWNAAFCSTRFGHHQNGTALQSL